MPLETADTHQGQEALRGEGRQAGQASALGVEARAESSATLPLPGPRHSAEQRDGPACVPAQGQPGPDIHLPSRRAHTPWGAEPTETAAHGTHTHHCRE